MDTRLEDSFFESFRKINALQKEIEKEDKNSVFEDMERKRYDLITEYLFLGETEKTIVVLQKFIDANAEHLSFGGSMLTLQMFSTFILLLLQRGYTDRIDKYLDLFNKCASEMKGGFMLPFKESIINYGKAFTAIIRKESDKYDFCINALSSLEEMYERDQDSLPLAFHISILEYKALCYRNMGDYESAITSLLKALSFQQDNDMLARRMNTLRTLSSMYEFKGDFKTALKYYNTFRSIDDDLYTTKNYAYSHFLIDVYGLSKQEIQTDMLIEGNKDLSGQILRDGMTGIYNRRFLHQLTEESFTSGNVWGAWGAIMFDIDFFKSYNDNYGHLAGDNVIVTFGNILKIYETSNIFP
ncbi:MAG: diguanylate cyclase, partial [Lachnospiraceae bacterium]|nr:diguanylate cyclase [Lachnospiraceae bacterium]